MPDYKPYITDDGSIGLFSGDVDDIFHSRYGALTEAYEKFIIPLDLEERFLSNPELNVLDICYGIGYNTKALINTILKIINKKIENNILEIDNIPFRNMPIKNAASNNAYNDTIDTNNTITHQSFFKALLGHKEDKRNEDKSIGLKSYLHNKETVITNANEYEEYSKTNSPEILEKVVQQSPTQQRALNFPKVNIDALEYEKEFVYLSPLIKDICYDDKYKLNSNIDKLVYESLVKQYGKDYLNTLKRFDILRDNKKFFKHVSLLESKNNVIRGYKHSSYYPKIALLHNIYYQHLSKRVLEGRGNNTSADYRNISKRALAKNTDILKSVVSLNFFIDDARKSVLKLNKKYDYIFLDAFTPSKLPTLWSVEFFMKLAHLIKDDGMLITYSNSARIRSALQQAGFNLGCIKTKDNHFIGTIASKNINMIKYPLSKIELGLLQTKAGIPYKDPNLSTSPNDIIKLLNDEITTSSKISSSQYFKGINNAI